MSKHDSNGHNMPIRAAKVDIIPQMTMPSEPLFWSEGIKKSEKDEYLRKFNC